MIRIEIRNSTGVERSISEFAERRMIATKEDRNLAQLCEMLLRGAAASYKEEGHAYLLRLLSRQKKEASSE